MNENKLKNITLEEIQKYVDMGWSYESIGVVYGVSGSAIRKKIKKLNGVLPRRREISLKETFNKNIKLTPQNYCECCGTPIANKYKYCSIKCQHKKLKEEKIKDWQEHPEKYNKEDIPHFIRDYLIDKYKGCQICGWNEVNPFTGKIPLEVHHIDGNCTNNIEQNLQLLCPNHHSLTSNIGSLNKGNSKRYKYKQYKMSLNIVNS